MRFITELLFYGFTGLRVFYRFTSFLRVYGFMGLRVYEFTGFFTGLRVFYGFTGFQVSCIRPGDG